MKPYNTQELEAIISEYHDTKKKSRFNDGSDVFHGALLSNFQTRCIAAVDRAVGNNSVYYKQVTVALEAKVHISTRLALQIGVIESLLHDIKNGFMNSFEEAIHGELFGDFLEMADYLLTNGFKDAAAVIAGSTLESHLRQLCKKLSIPIEQKSKPKKADTMNTELASASAYLKLDQKNVTAWLDLRNKAAHGQYEDYGKEQVAIMISGIRDFVTRNPA